KICLSPALIPPLRLPQISPVPARGQLPRRARHMRNFASRTVAATVGAIALGGAGIGSAAAADMPQQPPPPEYYGEQEGYNVRPPPTAYVYPAPVYGYYAPPPVVVVPPPYYGRTYYGRACCGEG